MTCPSVFTNLQKFPVHLALLTGIFILLVPNQGLSSLGEEFSATPPFLNNELKPNVMFILDNSSSMKFKLYTADFDHDKAYYGLFDDTKTYRYDSTIGIDYNAYNGGPTAPYTIDTDNNLTTNDVQSIPGAFIETNTRCTPAFGQNCWDGNFLNWLTTKRIDAARKVLVGGKTESRSGHDYLGLANGNLQWKITANNERCVWSQCDIEDRQYSLSQNYSPFPNDTLFNGIIPSQDGDIHASGTPYDPYAKIEVDTPRVYIWNKIGNIIGETGTVIDIDDHWVTVNLNKDDYIDPVIIATPLSYDEYDPAVIRIQNVTPGSFEIRVEEWEYRDVWHPTENISFLVVERGNHILSGDQKITAGTVDIDQPGSLSGATTVDISSAGFAVPPIILTSVITNTNEDTVTTRLGGITANQFSIGLQEEENSTDLHPVETVSYIGLEPGTYSDGIGTSFEVGTISAGIGNWSGNRPADSRFTDISFNDGKEDPQFFAKIQTINDTDPVSLRYQNLDQNSVQIFPEEEQSSDTERAHSAESVGYVVIHHTPLQYNLAIIVNEEPKGLLQDIYEKMRLGVAFFKYAKGTDIYDQWSLRGGTLREPIPLNPFIRNPDPATGYRVVETPVKTPLDRIIDVVEHHPNGTSTPLAETYYEVMRYFQQVDPYYDNVNTTDQNHLDNYFHNNDWDPYFYSEYNQKIRCAKSFVLLFTDGQPTRDGYVPSIDGTHDHDGDNETGDCFSAYYSCNKNLDDLAYWANNNDLRTDTGMSANQNLVTYTVAFANDTVPKILQDTADNGGGTAYAAADGATLKESLRDAFNSILEKTSAGSSVSVLSDKATAGAVVNQALFFPSKTLNSNFEIAWSGALNGYWFFTKNEVNNIREETIPNYILDTFADHALDFAIDADGNLEINHYTVDSDGAMDSLAGTYSDVNQIPMLWDAGTILNTRSVERAPDTNPTINMDTARRVIWGHDESGHLTEFTTDNYSLFDDLFGDNYTDFPECLNVPDGDGDGHVDAGYPSKQLRSENLIAYVRGAADDFSGAGTSGGPCRSRRTQTEQNTDPSDDIWKLGDIIYSSPTVVEYTDNSVIYVAANDGMLHAFNGGKIRKDGLTNTQSAKIRNISTGEFTDTLGKELWAFIPKAAMPYLKYLADPEYSHMYSVDLAPYIITNQAGHKILIGGMRFGGATTSSDGTYWAGDTDHDGTVDTDGSSHPLQIVPKECTPAQAVAGNCLGVSSYFALDITDSMNPQLLWEFNHNLLGFSYSGPAYITRGSTEYIMFASGPTNYRGEAAGQNVRLFLLEMDNTDFSINSATIKPIPSITNGFVGRLFTNGIDSNKDGSTDLVTFGVSWYNGSWKGNVYALAPNDGAASTWELTQVLQNADKPVTAKVAYENCYGSPFIYFGSGRWFYKDDDTGVGGGNETLYGVKIQGCIDNLEDGDSLTTCAQAFQGMNTNGAGSSFTCDRTELANTAWSMDMDTAGSVDGAGNMYYKERDVTDPTISASNHIFFTSMEPSSDVCTFGGRTRLWAFNCMSGHNIFEDGCPQPDGTLYSTAPPEATILLQLSGGDLENLDIDTNTFSDNSNYTTPWKVGTPPEGAPTLYLTTVPAAAQIILWLER